jgi:hypothetical protein
MSEHRAYRYRFADIHDAYVQKAERKERTRDEVDEILRWHTGYSQQQLIDMLDDDTDLAGFYEGAPRLNPHRSEIRGVICGVRIEEIEEPLMREIRYTDKMIDELAKGRPMTKILRG